MTDAPPPIPQPDAPAYAYVPQPGPGGDLRLAHPAMRALAFLLDGLGTFVVTTVLVFAGLFAEFFGFAAIPVVPLASAILATVLTATRGVTPAKALLRLRVVDRDTGRPIGWGRATLRSLVIVSPLLLGVLLTIAGSYLPYEMQGYLLSWTTTFVWIPMLAWVAMLIVLSLSPRHRGLQDRAARSVVVRR